MVGKGHGCWRADFEIGKQDEERQQYFGRGKGKSRTGGNQNNGIIRVFAGAQGVIPAVKQLGEVTAEHGRQNKERRPA